MLKNRQRLFRLIIILFMLTVSVPMLPCETVYIHGLFGEIRSSAVVTDSGADVSEVASRIVEHIRIKGANIFNIWLLIVVLIVCLAFEMCVSKLPRKDTMVAKKVRMNN